MARSKGLTPERLKAIQEAVAPGSQSKFVKLIGVTRMTWYRWLGGVSYPHRMFESQLLELEKSNLATYVHYIPDDKEVKKDEPNK